MELRPITFSVFCGVTKSISDDDLCASCLNCQYNPGENSTCAKGWPGFEDLDGYVQSCHEHQSIAQ